METYKKFCVVCTRPFEYEQYPSVEKANNRLTCSKKCSYLLRAEATRGKFVPNGWNERNNDTWIVKACLYCGKDFESAGSTHRKFCSRTCFLKHKGEQQRGRDNPNWKPRNDKRPYLSVNKKVRRDVIRERIICERCGSSSMLQIHHKDRNRGNNSDKNILLLCKDCHAKEHELNGDKEVANLIRHHPQSK